MGLFLLLILCFSSCFADKEEVYERDDDAELQSEIEKYLGSLTQQQQPLYEEPIVQPVLKLPPYSMVRSSQFSNPSARALSNVFNGAHAHASAGDGTMEKPWAWFQNSLLKNSPQAFAASSVNLRNPDDRSAQYDAKAAAYSSLRDVESERDLDENPGILMSSNSVPEKKTPQPIQQQDNTVSVSEAMARKSGSLTTLQQNTETIKADNQAFSDVYFVAIVAGCSAAGIFGVISAGFCFYRLQKNSKAAAEVDYPAYGVTGPSKDTTSPKGDRKLAQSAQMYHYQHQKQQMIAVEKAGSTKNTSASDADSEEENEEGDYTVYECPGLAPTGEMEVKNPLFNDDSTPMSPPVIGTKPDSIETK